MVGSPVSSISMYVLFIMNFIKGCDWVFKSKKGSSDYHDEMNATSFEEWFQEKLLSALSPTTLIVMDNASYHRLGYIQCTAYSTSF